jgi:hypothetical protein
VVCSCGLRLSQPERPPLEGLRAFGQDAMIDGNSGVGPKEM